MSIDEWVAFAIRKRQAGQSIEEVLTFLRAQGAGIADSMKVIRSAENIRLGEAKLIIDASKVWADVHDLNRSLREIAISAIENEDE